MEASFTFGYSKLRDINGRKKDPARGQGQFNLGTNAQKNVIFFIQQILILDMLPKRQLHHATAESSGCLRGAGVTPVTI